MTITVKLQPPPVDALLVLVPTAAVSRELLEPGVEAQCFSVHTDMAREATEADLREAGYCPAASRVVSTIAVNALQAVVIQGEPSHAALLQAWLHHPGALTAPRVAEFALQQWRAGAAYERGREGSCRDSLRDHREADARIRAVLAPALGLAETEESAEVMVTRLAQLLMGEEKETQHLGRRLEEARARAETAERAIGRITAAAHAAGWNGTENPKTVWGFITHLATERDEAKELARVLGVELETSRAFIARQGEEATMRLGRLADLRAELAQHKRDSYAAVRERDTLRAELADAAALLEATRQATGIATKVADVPKVVADIVANRKAASEHACRLEADLTRLTAPGEGEPTDEELRAAWEGEGNNTFSEAVRALWRAGAAHERARQAATVEEHLVAV